MQLTARWARLHHGNDTMSNSWPKGGARMMVRNEEEVEDGFYKMSWARGGSIKRKARRTSPREIVLV